LTDPKIKAKLTLKEGLLNIQLSSSSLARLVECNLTGLDVIFSDNYFDLPAKKVITITAPLPSGWNLAKACAAFKVRSVYDSYSK
jgi:beta-mannosidase